MDWCSWLSKTTLDPSLVHEYGQALVRNELLLDDLAYFDHEFLQSLGISIAKHRLEIIKLVRKEAIKKRAAVNILLRVVNNTRKLIARNIAKLGQRKKSNNSTLEHQSPRRDQWSGAHKKIGVCQGGNVMWSGPLDKRTHQRDVFGPLDWRVMRDRTVYPDWSPMEPFHTDNDGLIERLGLSPYMRYDRGGKGVDWDHEMTHSLWSLMFRDMKPT